MPKIETPVYWRNATIREADKNWVWDIRGGVEGWWPVDPPLPIYDLTEAEEKAIFERDEAAYKRQHGFSQ